MSKITKRTNTSKSFAPKSNKYAVAQAASKLEKVYNGTANLKDLLNVKESVIDFTKCERKIKMIQAIYNAGSQVGACTVVAGNMYSVKINEKSAEVFKKSLKMLKNNDNPIEYTSSLWIEGYNKFSCFAFSTGHKYTYYVVTNAEMEELKTRIENMDYATASISELQMLQADLPPFVRAWQESSIDCSKDKSKVFKYSYSDFFKKINVMSTHLKANAEDITMNLKDAKMLHKAGRTDDISFKINLPIDNTEELYEDMLGEVNIEIYKSVEEYFNGDMLDLYKMSNREYYERYADACLEYPELALYIHQVYTLCTQAYQEDTKVEKSQYETLRDAIYSKAVECGITDMTKVVEVAVSVAMRYIKERKDKQGNRYIDLGVANVDNYKPSKVMNIFPAEYVALRTGQKETKELTLIYVSEGTTIEEGQTVEFVNGVSVDDTVEVEELYSGVAYNRCGKLVYDVDVYEFNHISTVITVATFAEGTTPQEQETDLGEFTNEYLETNESVIITGKNNNVLVGADKRTLVARVVSSPELMPNGKPAVYTVENHISFKPNEGRERVFFIVLNK